MVADDGSFMLGDWLVEPGLDRLSRGHQSVHLRPRVMNFLVYMARQGGRVVSADELVAGVWSGRFISSGAVYNCVTEVRQALGTLEDGQQYLENIPRRGYRLRVPVTDAPDTLANVAHRRPVGILTAAVAISVLVAFGGIFLWLYPSYRGGEPVPTAGNAAVPAQSIAVLPFVNASGSAADEYFSDGLTETLLHALAQIPDLQVTARTSSFYFKGRDLDVRQIGERLGVSNVLAGSVQRHGDNIRVVAHLIDARSGFQLWSRTYDRTLGDIISVQDDIAGSVALAMKVTLADRPDGSGIATTGTIDSGAYDRYLRGLHLMNVNTLSSLPYAESEFRAALVLDPDFHEARLQLAYTYMWQRSNGILTETELVERTTPLLTRLLEDRPDDGLALALDARIRGYHGVDIDKHLAQLTSAVQRTPSETELYRRIADVLRIAGRPREALEWLERGIEVDPLYSNLHFARANVLMQLGDVDSAERAYATTMELNPDNPSACGYALEVPWRRKEYVNWLDGAEKCMAMAPLDYEFPVYLALRLYTFGLLPEADGYLQQAHSIAPNKPYVRTAQLYRLVVYNETKAARDLSERLLRDDIDPRWGAYFFAAMVFASTMIDLGMSDEAMLTFEELRPGVTLPDFQPRNYKDIALQYHVALIRTGSMEAADAGRLLDTMTSRWDQVNSAWHSAWRSGPGFVAAIEMARGRPSAAVDLALQDLETGIGLLLAWDWRLRYERAFYFKALASEPAVAERLAVLRAEAEAAGAQLRGHISAKVSLRTP